MFVTKQKPFPPARMKEVEKCDLSGLKDCFHLNQCLEKLKKTGSTSKNEIFVNIGLPLMAIMVWKR